MRTVGYSGCVIVLLCLAGGISAVDAAEPPTLWSFLGIPQGLQKLGDATINRRGNCPGLERKPPLKALADPSNLAEAEPEVIQKAAQIKIEADKAKQKIKAIKYLAKIGCGKCYEGVDEALLSALEDCTSDKVRYEAATALGKAAGDPCEVCGGAGCCNAKTMTKLYELAFEQDENCCYKEPSARVRRAARNALRACQRVVPMAPEPEPVPDEGVEYLKDGSAVEPESGNGPLKPEPFPDGQKPIPLQDQELKEPTPAQPSPSDSSAIVNPITLTGMSQIEGIQSAHRLVMVQRRIAPPAPGFPRKYVGQAKTSYRQESGSSSPRKANLRRPGQSKRLTILPPPPRR